MLFYVAQAGPNSPSSHLSLFSAVITDKRHIWPGTLFILHSLGFSLDSERNCEDISTKVQSEVTRCPARAKARPWCQLPFL